MHKAPLNESAAAGVLLMAGWQDMAGPEGLGNDAVLADPMCGSGTLLLEGALIARNVPPGLLRPADSWPFARWPDVDKRDVREAMEAARSMPRAWKGRLLGNDVHGGALALAAADAERAGFGSQLSLRRGDCSDWVLAAPPALVATNPPWGQRLLPRSRSTGPNGRHSDASNVYDDAGGSYAGRGHDGGGVDDELSDELRGSWLSLSAFLRAQCGGSRAAVLSGSQAAVNCLRMKPKRKKALRVRPCSVFMQWEVGR